MMSNHNFHGTGLVYGGVGILIRGPSGAGKSLLALSLIDFAHFSNTEAALVSDDQIYLSIKDQKLIMRAPPAIKGKIELYGRGILNRAAVSDALVDLVIDIESKIVRMPDPGQLTIEILSIKLPRCPVANTRIIGLTHQRMIALDAIETVRLELGRLEK